MPSVEEIRWIVQDYLAGRAGWRRNKAEEIEHRHPDRVPKNIRHAESIEAVAAFAATLSADDPAGAALTACAESTDEFGVSGIPDGLHGWTIHLGDPRKGLAPDAVEAAFRGWVDGVVAEAKNPPPREGGI